MKVISILFVMLSLMIGCAHSPNFSKITLGLTKEEVIDRIGSPDTTAAKGGAEYLNYVYWQDTRFEKNYFVRLTNGKVESYGEVGDFDSARAPAQQYDINIKKEVINKK